MGHFKKKEIVHLDGAGSKIAFSLNNKYLAIGNFDGTIQLWDEKDYSMEKEITRETMLTDIGHAIRFVEYGSNEDNISKLTFSSDGSLLYVESTIDNPGQSDNSIVTLVDVNKQQRIGYPIPIRGIGMSISKNGKTMLTPGYVWDLNPQSWAQTACKITGRNLTYEEWTQYFPYEEYRVTCSQWPIDLVNVSYG